MAMTSRLLQPVERPPLLHQSVQEALRSYIVANNLRATDPLPPEGELARQLNVSRNSVREAVKALESLGVLEVRRGRGIFVRRFSLEPLLNGLRFGLLVDLQELAELLEVRRMLEVSTMALGIERMSAEQRDSLRAIVEQMRQCAERNEVFPEEDRAFHRVLVEHVGNQTMMRLLDLFWLAFHRAVAVNEAAVRDRDPHWTYMAHVAILDAILAGDSVAAQRALDQHYAGLESRLARAQQSGSADSG